MAAQLSKEKDMGNEKRELALAPDSMQGVYYTTVRTGLCNAYLAASVVNSNMVSTSKSGAMGTVSNLCGVLYPS